MTRDELLLRIATLKAAAAELNEPERTFCLDDIAALETALAGMALDDVLGQLSGVTLPDMDELDGNIAAAQDATAQQQARVDSIAQALRLLSGILPLPS